MKCTLATVLLSIALLSQAFAVLRPLFPIKPAPPLGDEMSKACLRANAANGE
jgi:hypothetical protein